MESKNKPKIIEIDPEEFFNYSSAEEILKYVGERVKCEICDKTYASKQSLSIHIKSVHQKIKDNICKFCEKAYSRNYDLQIHMKTVHKEGVKKIQAQNERKKDEEKYEIVHKEGIKFFNAHVNPVAKPTKNFIGQNSKTQFERDNSYTMLSKVTIF